MPPPPPPLNPPPPPPGLTPPPLPTATPAPFPVPLPVTLAAPAPGTPPLPTVLTVPPTPSAPVQPLPVHLISVAAPLPVIVLNPAPAPPAAPAPPTPTVLPVPTATQQIANIGQTIGGPGQLVGNIATLAEGGPVGAMIAAARAIQNQVEQSLKAAVDGIGESLQKVAALDPRVFLDGLNALVDKVPLVGPALAAVNSAIAGFVEGLDQTARRLGQFSPQLAVAQANAQVAQTLGDFRRAQTLGSGLARFTEAQSNLSQAAQDTLTELLRPLLPIVTNILNSLTVAVREIPSLPADIYNAFVAAVNLVIDGLNAIANNVSFGFAAAIPHLQTIARHTDPRRDTAPLNVLEEVLRAHVADLGRQPVATDTAPGFPALGGIF